MPYKRYTKIRSSPSELSRTCSARQKTLVSFSGSSSAKGDRARGYTSKENILDSIQKGSLEIFLYKMTTAKPCSFIQDKNIDINNKTAKRKVTWGFRFLLCCFIIYVYVFAGDSVRSRADKGRAMKRALRSSSGASHFPDIPLIIPTHRHFDL